MSEYEIIIVDSGSTDDTLSILNEYKQSIHSVLHAVKAGPYPAMNAGIDKARGHYVSILNADDYWLRQDLLETIHRAFTDTSRRLAFVHGNIRVLSKDNTSNYRVKPASNLTLFLGMGLPFCHPATFFLRSTYLLYGSYNWISFPMQADRCLGFDLQIARADSLYLNIDMTAFSTGGVSSHSYSPAESRSIVDRFPIPRRFFAAACGWLTNYEPQFYSGYYQQSVLSALFLALRIRFRRILRSFYPRQHRTA